MRILPPPILSLVSTRQGSHGVLGMGGFTVGRPECFLGSRLSNFGERTAKALGFKTVLVAEERQPNGPRKGFFYYQHPTGKFEEQPRPIPVLNQNQQPSAN